jgi:hypothetical protein
MRLRKRERSARRRPARYAVRTRRLGQPPADRTALYGRRSASARREWWLTIDACSAILLRGLADAIP